jgi:Ca2+-binding RTX toxin-like protein
MLRIRVFEGAGETNGKPSYAVRFIGESFSPERYFETRRITEGDRTGQILRETWEGTLETTTPFNGLIDTYRLSIVEAGVEVTQLYSETFDTPVAVRPYWGSGAYERAVASYTNANGVEFTGNNFANTFVGSRVADVINGGGGDDNLRGLGGNDRIDGGGGSDLMFGGVGNDVYIVNQRGDRALEQVNEGTDTVRSAVSFILGPNVENLVLTGAADANTTGGGNPLDNVITGDAGNNRLVGARGDDTLQGAAGDDFLFGGADNDVLRGGNGRDQLIGGLGTDDMTGGAGVDFFIFRSAAESPAGSGRDIIRDFQTGIDKINLRPIDANAGAGGNQVFTFIDDAAFTGTAGQLRYQDGILAGDTNGDGVADLEIQLANNAAISATDILL